MGAAAGISMHLALPLLLIASLVDSIDPDHRAAAACTFYVSYAHGSDGAAGTSSPNAFKTVQKAVDSTAGSKGKTVCLMADGPHYITRQINIGAYNSGTEDTLLKIIGDPADIAAGRGRPVVSGAVPITRPFTPDPGAALQGAAAAQRVSASIAGLGLKRPSTLLINGLYAQRARSPRRGMGINAAYSRYTDDSSTFKWSAPIKPCGDGRQGGSGTCPAVDKLGFVFNTSESSVINPSMHNLRDVQVLHFHAWTAFWSNLSTVIASNSTLLFSDPCPGAAVGQYRKQGGQRYLLENVFEGLDEPGEWYWDDSTNKLYVIPEEEDTEMEVLVPQVERLFNVYGGSWVAVADIQFKHASVGDRVNQYHSSIAAIAVQESTHISFERVSVSHCGGTGWLLGQNVQDIVIESSAATDLGGEGIVIGSASNVSDIMLNNNFVNNTALIILGQPGGIRVQGLSNITVSHNSVGHVPYAGIMVGWQTGLAAPTTSPIFRVEHNHIHDFGLGILSDFAGVYISTSDGLCFQKNPMTCYLPTVVHNNLIEDCSHYNYGCNGVYMDEQVSGVTITSNIVRSVMSAGVYFHCGTGNSATNNIIAEVDLDKAGFLGTCNKGGNPTWPRVIRGFEWRKNILYYPGSTTTKLFGQGDWLDYGNVTFDDNIYWAGNATNRATWKYPNGTTFLEWQKEGNDVHSMQVDPLFVDYAAGSYALQPDSPAVKQLGFEPIDASTVGCIGNPFVTK